MQEAFLLSGGCIIMSYVFLVLLYLLAAFSLLQGISLLAHAGTAVQQIFGAIWCVVLAVSVTGLGIMHALLSRLPAPGKAAK